MDWNIVLSNAVYDEIFTLMKHIRTLNEENEIGGWLTGNWVLDENNATLTLDSFIIPKQTVSKVEVDIGPESMIDMIKEFGPETSNRIKAHWHIHPFNTGPTDWSSIDDEKITDFMDPNKKREIFVFLLSSLDQIKARIEIRTKTTLLGKQLTSQQSYNNISVNRAGDGGPELLEKLKTRIAEKVETGVSLPHRWPQQGHHHHDPYMQYQHGYQHEQYGNDAMHADDYSITRHKDAIHLKLPNALAEEIELYAENTVLLRYPSHIKMHRRFQTWKYRVKDKFPTVEDLKIQLEQDIGYVLATLVGDSGYHQ